jgi:two-component system, chemotaxis family, protein-glutamate methylesterase/glutaminase
MIKVLIVDDSKLMRELLTHILSSDKGIEIVGVACSGYEAIDLVMLKKPDVITMDIHMPGMDGYETSRTIMETLPTPIVIVSGIEDEKESDNMKRYLEAGAVAFVLRPAPIELPQFPDFCKELIQKVKLMAEIKVIKRYPRNRKDHYRPQQIAQIPGNDLKRIKIIAIGASTGGPLALQMILSRLPGDLPVPILIVQHIAPGFLKVFQKMLDSTSGIKLKIAEDNEQINAGTGYIAPDGFHMGVTRDARIHLSNKPPEHGSKPSVSYLFRSVAQSFGANSLGVLLTGMGQDGAEELKDMKDKGALTVVQNEVTSVVFGMPGEAIKLGASNNALSPERIAEIISKSGSKK